MHISLPHGRRPVAGLTAGLLVSTGLVALTVAMAPGAGAAPPAGVSPIVARSAANVTADGLPTVQIDGVVWTQEVVGNTVYAGGEFANARPAGAAPGTQLTPRNNLLAYDLTTGNLVTSFAPSMNAEVKAITVSPDGSRVYVGGNFTQANGVNRFRIAAYSTSTGALLTSFTPSLDAAVYSISATNDAVYVGGSFSNANGVPRSRLAAFSPTNGALLAWAPSADAAVNAIQVTPSGSKVIVGGSFQKINGAAAYGLGAIDPSGALVPWAANQVVQDGGSTAAVLNLSTDGTSIFSSSYVFGSGGNFEGNMSADPETGTINYLADCHGDTYGTFASGDVLYSVSHQHYCTNIGGFPDTNPRNRWFRSTAFTNHATGTVQTNGQPGGGYGNFAGQPSPSLINWLPDMTAGAYTGQNQAAWSVAGNSQYVVEGGEFPRVNGVAQQGLVRFAIPSIAPKKQGPVLSAANVKLSTLPISGNTVRVTWASNYDRDDLDLTYTLTRNGVPIYTTTKRSLQWVPATMGFFDTGLQPNTTYTYRVRILDSDGNNPASNNIPATTLASGGPANGPYVNDVLAAGANHFWRLDQSTGATLDFDRAGFDDQTINSGVTAGTAGAINDSDTASTFNGTTTGFAAPSTPAVAGPDVFTESAWFSTTSTGGGKIVGFGNANTGTSTSYDRHLYMDAAGHVNFGVYRGASFIVTTPNTYRDGGYHQAVGTLSPEGMKLYIDGKLIGTNTGTTTGQPYNGYWRIGGDTSWSGNSFFNGKIDDVAIFPTALTLSQIRQQYIDSGRSIVGGTAPADTYGSTVWNDSPSAYYRLDETTGTTAVDLSGNLNDGTYRGTTTKNVASPVSAPAKAVTFNGINGTISSGQQVAAPSVYSEEVWFKTNSISGGKLIGFGNSQTGNSTSYDRHVYMLSSGKLVFGTHTGALNLATSAASYNDNKWHHTVATQGPDGMTLYVDGQIVATNPQTGAEAVSGYWRIGGDNLAGWGANGSYFAGTLDEAAVYNSELTVAQVRAHYEASPASVNALPTAAFTSTPTGATVAFNGTGSSDPDGTIAGYSWTFGDGGTSIQSAPSHTYVTSGTYQVKLTVTDNRGGTNSVTKSVTVNVPTNQSPTAVFSATPTNLSVAFDSTGTGDPDGTIATYAWDFGDGGTSGAVSPTHVYGGPGTYSVTLTVTDNQGAPNSVTHSVTVSEPANVSPTAAFTATPSGLSVGFDGTGSVDSDGTIAGYAWTFGDGGTSTAASPTHVYPDAGTYPVQLTVTDNRGGSDSVTHNVTTTLPANVKPTAAFTATPSGLSVGFDGTGSVDSDGTIASYAWDFGDGATSAAVSPTHLYTEGTYTVTLTVTDNRGGTDTATKIIPVTDAIAKDDFARTATGGWGPSDFGGPWTVSSGASSFSVNGSQGLVRLSAPGVGPLALLNGVSAVNVNEVVDASLDKAAAGNGTTVTLLARRNGTSDYRLRLKFLTGGIVHLAWSKVVSGVETTGSEVNVTGLTYTPGDVLRVRFQVTGNGTTTTLQGKVWLASAAEPAAWRISATDTAPTLQGAGAVGLLTNLGSTAPNAPVVVTYDNYAVRLP
ncbi:MAG: hypothetical protein QOF92_892 [Pseudonocardiales bacterium]|nr:hypothetical protein [Pseudonocardiales bacterium]